jgi:4-hydroxy-3-polyprenylbenzoate decarboxylase
MATQRRGCEALLFRKLKGDASGSRILINMLGASKERFALAVGLDPDLSIRDMITATGEILKKRIPPKLIPRGRASVSEVLLTEGEIDLTRFPVPKFWPGDGGRYIGTGSVMLTRNPETGVLNAGVYRHQLHSSNVIGLSIVPGRHGLRNCEAWWSRGRPAEVVVAYGIDPALFIAATHSFGYDESELDVAGGLIGSPIELTDAEFIDLPIPARAELVIEGLVHKDHLEPEGPLGEWHGFYSSATASKPAIDVKAVHHRKSPILTAALMANHPSCEIGAYYAIVRSARICDNLEKMGVSGVVGAYAHPGAANAYGLVVISLTQLFPHLQVRALRNVRRGHCTKWIIASIRCRPHRHRSGDVGDDQGQSERRYRRVAQHLYDSERSEPGARDETLWVQGAHQRMHAVQVHRLQSRPDVPAQAHLRSSRRTLDRSGNSRSGAGIQPLPRRMRRLALPFRAAV